MQSRVFRQVAAMRDGATLDVANLGDAGVRVRTPLKPDCNLLNETVTGPIRALRMQLWCRISPALAKSGRH